MWFFLYRRLFFAFETDAIILCFWIPHFCGMTGEADAVKIGKVEVKK